MRQTRSSAHLSPDGNVTYPTAHAETTAEQIARKTLEAERKRIADRRRDRVVNLLVLATGVFLSGWFFMLAVGIVRANWIPDFPTVDYGTATMLMALIHSAWAFQSLARDTRPANR